MSGNGGRRRSNSPSNDIDEIFENPLDRERNTNTKLEVDSPEQQRMKREQRNREQRRREEAAAEVIRRDQSARARSGVRERRIFARSVSPKRLAF